MKISIVIPTLNEHVLLPHLLESIKSQTFNDYEVIVADAGSTDGTQHIAASYGARIVPGGMPGPGRNAGARSAKGDYLFFLDADVILPTDFLELAYNEMQERFLDLATCEARPLSDYAIDRVIHRFMNAWIHVGVRIDPHAMGYAIFVTRRLFERVQGFDPTISVGEDSEFVKRAAKFRNLHFLDSVYLHVSVRRFEKEGRLQSATKGIRLYLYRIFRGEIRADQIEYKFGEYEKKKEFEKKSLLDQLEKSLMRLEERMRENARTKTLTQQDQKATAQLLEDARQKLKSLFVPGGKSDTAQQ